MLFSVAFRYMGREYYVELKEGMEVSFGKHKKDQIQIPNAEEHMLWLRANADKVMIAVQRPLSAPGSSVALNELMCLSKELDAVLYVSRISGRSGQSLELPYSGQLLCGRKPSNDIILSYPIVSGNHFRITCEAGQAHIEDLGSTNHLYLNGKRISKAVMKSGDVLSIYTFRFVLENGKLYFDNMIGGLKLSEKIGKQPRSQDAKPVTDYENNKAVKDNGAPELLYHLSPRTRERLPHEPIILSGAPGQAHAPGGRHGNLMYLISSGAMMAASLATGGITPAALLARAAGMLSPVASMAMYGKMSKEEQKQFEEYEQLRKERYQAYIDDQKARISKVADVQRRIVSYENQSPEMCMKTALELRRNLWERMPSDSDFLVTRLGTGKIKLCVEVKSRADTDGFHIVDDELEELSGQIIEETRYVDNAPVCVSLREYPIIGIVGSQERRCYLLRSILVELTAQHSYKDLRLIGLFDKDSRNVWGPLRWLPHIWDETGQVRYIAFDQKQRHTVCELLAEVIRHRKNESQESYRQDSRTVLPHYLVIAEQRELLFPETVYEDLISNNPALGITTVFLAESMYDLPQTCRYLIDLTDTPQAYERDKYDERSCFVQDEPVHHHQLETYARYMAAIELEDKKARASIPSAVTFLQGYGAVTVEDLHILDRWENSKPYRTLAAPVGIMDGGATFSLDIRNGEQSHGPHGLLAGTTGSGKSEFLQTWILSMAVNYHPYDVNFVIIDYKGGGMSDLMEPLPHVVGKITNIDRNISRSLVSLKSELKRRQELFRLCGVNNIDKYQEAYRNGAAKERLPHLIIVTDEFAEMKKEEPEFMTELNSVATVGRSLGIHLLLATQRPAGVVTDQINSNSRFRVCMKVQDVADSREMIKRPDAARITQAGRAYIRVGEDELFELFQSFYSAAEYTGNQSGGMKNENQIRVVGVTGERINLLKKQKKKHTSDMDELTAVIKHMNEICAQQGIKKLPGPWLPELTKWLTFQELGVSGIFDGTEWPKERPGLSVPVGKYDIPERQKQGVLSLDFLETGHLGIFGVPSSGKTMLLKAILMSLALHYTPRTVQITVVDAGNWSLSEFSDMPHVREVILNQEEEKLKKFAMRLKKEMEARKQAFLKHAVNSLPAYWEAVSKELPAMVVMIDHLGSLLEQYIEMLDLLTDVAANGMAYGIFLVFTANSSMGISYKFLQLIKGAITLQMAEKGDYASLVGPIAGVSLPTVPGRGLLKGNPPVAFQSAVYMDEKGEQARHEAVLRLALQMKEAWKQKNQEQTIQEEQKADAGAPLSEKETTNTEQGQGTLLLGTDVNTLEPIRIELIKPYLLLISSDSREKNCTVLKKLEKYLAKDENNRILYLSGENQQEQLQSLVEILNERKKNRIWHKKEQEEGEQVIPEGYMQICLFVEDLPSFAAGLPEESRKGYHRIFTMASGLGIMVLVAGLREELSKDGPDLLLNAALAAQNALAFGSSPMEHHFAWHGAACAGSDVELEEDEAALIQQERLTILRF